MNDSEMTLPDPSGASSGITAEILQAELPQFEVERLLGSGGMGAVFKAHQPRLKRDVAIKVLTLDCAEEPQFKARFEREAHAMARLQHKRIIAIYDTGMTGGGWPYIVMEYVDGVPLSAVRNEAGCLPQDKVLALMIQICDALHYAHEQGIVHRDIKPANIMLDTGGRVKMADFGLAKVLDNGPGNIALTRTNAVMGTMAYMAPEQLMAQPDLDARADIYALGVMLYELLTGKVPRGAWSPPSQLVEGIDPRFDDIVGRALQEDRAARYPNVVEMWQALLEIRNQPVEAVTPGASQARSRPLPGVSASSKTQATVTKADSFPWLATALVVLPVAAGLAWLTLRQGAAPAHVPPAVPQPSPPLPAPAVAKTTEPVAVTANPSPPVMPVDPPVVKPAPPVAPVQAPASASQAPPVAATPMPAVVEAKPVVPAPTPTPARAPSRLAVVLAPVMQRYRKDVATGYGTSVAALNANYARALTNALAEATAKGDLDAVVAIKAERDQVQQLGDKPLRDGAAITPSLITLRNTYGTALKGYQRQRDRALVSTFVPELRRLLHSHAAELPGAKSNPAVRSLRALGDRFPELSPEILHDVLMDDHADLIAAMAARQRPSLRDLAVGKLHGAGFSDSKNFSFAPGDAWPWFVKAPAQTVRLLGGPSEVLAVDGAGTLSGRELTQTIPSLNRGIVDASIAYGGNLFIYDDGRVAYTSAGISLFATPPPAHFDLAAVKDAVSVAASNQHFGLLHEDGRLDLWTREGTGTRPLPVPANTGSLVRLCVVGWEKPCLFAQRLDGSFISLVPEGDSPPVKFLNTIPERVMTVECSAFTNHLLALTESGKVHAWQDGDEQGAATVPEDLGPATEIRVGKRLSAARVGGGRWRAWGSSRYGVADKINTLGPESYDLLFHDWDLAGGQVFWLER